MPDEGGAMRSPRRRTTLGVLVGLVVLTTATSSLATHPTDDGVGRQKATRRLAGPIARARAATATYATDLAQAQADGYRIITPMMPDMGYHFLNPSIEEFDVERPPILVYVRDGDAWQLVALEWVFPERPERDPIPGARYGSFGAACHFEDGTFVFEAVEAACPTASPQTGSPFSFWHPELVTLHVWAWYPNPDGVFNGTNRWVRPFNDDDA
jgi:hypothetical protein